MVCASSKAGKELTSWLSFVVSNCEFVTFLFGILGQVWYLIVSIPDLCTLTYIYIQACRLSHIHVVFHFFITFKDICGYFQCAPFRVWKRVKLSGSCLSTINGFGSTQLSDILNMLYRCSDIFLTKLSN